MSFSNGAANPNGSLDFAGPRPSPPPGPSYKWVVVGMLWFICFFNYADRMAINAVSTVLQKEFNFDNEQFGMIASAFMYVYALSAPIAGQIGDKFYRKFLILGGLIVWSGVTGATAWCRNLVQFVTVRATEGLGETFYFPATMSLVADYHTKRTRSLAMGLHQTSVYVGTVGGTVLAGFLAEKYGWRSPFVIFGICGIILGLVLAVFLREPARNEAERLESGVTEESAAPPAIPLSQFLFELLHTPSALLLILAFFGANSVGLVFMTWMPNYLSKNFGMGLLDAAFVSTFYQQLASVVGSILGGAMADRARRRLPGGRILTQSMGAFLGIPFMYLVGAATQRTEIIIFLCLVGLAKGIYDANIWASMYDVIHPSRRATMLGLANMIGWFGAGVGTYGFGLATTRWDISMSQALSSTAVIYAIVAVLLLAAALIFAPRDIRHAEAAGQTEEPAAH